MHYVYASHVTLDDSLGPKLAAELSNTAKLRCEGCELDKTSGLVEDICDTCINDLKNSYEDLCDDCFDGLGDSSGLYARETDDSCLECDSHQEEEDYICDSCIDKYLYVCSICKECL